MSKICPNFGGCRLVQTKVVITDDDERAKTISAWCYTEETWKKCKRYITRRSLWMCPDYILPDTEISENEIIERYEKGEQ